MMTRLKWFSGIMLVSVGLLTGQESSQTQTDATRKQGETDKRLLTQITQQQRKMNRLEDELAASYKRIETLKYSLSDSARATLEALAPASPRIPVVLNISGSGFIIPSAGSRDGLHKDDTFVTVRRDGVRLLITGKGKVYRVFKDDADCHTTANFGMRPEDEIYITNRSYLPFSIGNIQETPKAQ